MVLAGFIGLAALLVISGVKAFGKQIERPLNGVERLVATMLILGLLFKIQHWPGAGVLLVVSISTLAMLYWAGTWALLGSGQKDSVKPTVVGFALGFAYSIVAVGIMFKLQHWPGGQVMVIVGLISSVLCHIWHWFSVQDKESAYIWHTDTVIRAIWLLGWGAMLILPAG